MQGRRWLGSAAIGMWTEMVPTVPIPDLRSGTAHSLADKTLRSPHGYIQVSRLTTSGS